MHVSDKVNWEELARSTVPRLFARYEASLLSIAQDELNAASLKAVAVEAGMIALREGASIIEHEHFLRCDPHSSRASELTPWHTAASLKCRPRRRTRCSTCDRTSSSAQADPAGSSHDVAAALGDLPHCTLLHHDTLRLPSKRAHQGRVRCVMHVRGQNQSEDPPPESPPPHPHPPPLPSSPPCWPGAAHGSGCC